MNHSAFSIGGCLNVGRIVHSCYLQFGNWEQHEQIWKPSYEALIWVRIILWNREGFLPDLVIQQLSSIVQPWRSKTTCEAGFELFDMQHWSPRSASVAVIDRRVWGMSFLLFRQHSQFCSLNWFLDKGECGIAGIRCTLFLLLSKQKKTKKKSRWSK